MKRKIGIAATLLLSSTLLVGGIAKADDDDHEYEYNDESEYYDRGENSEYYGDDDDNYSEYEDDEDDDYEGGGYSNYTTVTPTVDSTWNIWSKTAVNNKATLPFLQAKKVTMTIANTKSTKDLYVIPRDGELFVPAKTVAEFLGAEATFYETSKILNVQSSTSELILRAGTNVAYEDNIKIALPSQAFYMAKEVYVPISVITNGLGYSVEYQQQSNTFEYTKL